MAPLRDCLRQLVTGDSRLDSVRARVPKAWVRVRDDVRARAEEDQVLSVSEFVNLCQNADDHAERVTDPAEQRALLGMLHQMGVVVAHGLTPATMSLTGLTLLDPNWFTGAVYALLDYGIAEFDRADLGERLRRDPVKAPLYPDERLDYIIDLLQQPEFALAFRMPATTDPPRYLLPEALPPSAPGAIAGWDHESLSFRFRYRNLPRGLIPQFQVLAHPHARPDDDRWRTGCTLIVEGCPVLVDGDLTDNRIDIRVTGPHSRRRDALAVVRALLAVVHGRLPESEPTAEVPLPDKPEVGVDYEYLCTLETDDGPDYQFRPVGGDRKYSVAELLHGVRSDRVPDPDTAPDTKPHPPQTNTVTAIINQTTPEPARTQAPPNLSNGLNRAASLGGLGTILGAAIGALCAAFYLHGQGDRWPLDVLATGAAIGSVIGGLLAFIGWLLSHQQ